MLIDFQVLSTDLMLKVDSYDVYRKVWWEYVCMYVCMSKMV